MARLRAESPVHRVRVGDDGDGWLVTRYADVTVASAAPEAGRALATMRQLERERSGAPSAAADDDPDHESDWIYREVLYLDPPDHTRLRKVVHRAFTPGAIGRLRPRIEQLTDGLLDQLTGPGPVDLMPALASRWLAVPGRAHLHGRADADRGPRHDRERPATASSNCSALPVSWRCCGLTRRCCRTR